MESISAVRLLLAAGALCAATAASGQAVQRPWYFEGNFGATKHGINGADMNRTFAAQGATTNSSFDENDQGWGLVLGYKFNRTWAVEGAYFDLGKFSFTGQTVAPVAGSFSGEYKAQAFSLAGVGNWPVMNSLNLYGKLGLAYTEAKLGVSSTGTALRGGKTDNANLMLGFGATYDFTPAFYGKVGWDRYFRVGDDQSTGRGDLDFLGLGVGMRF